MDLPEEEPMEVLDDYTITQLPNRTFLGMTVGYKLENSEHTMTLYVAPNMRAGLVTCSRVKQTNVPSGVQLVGTVPRERVSNVYGAGWKGHSGEGEH